MTFIRASLMALMCLSLISVVWADDDDKKDSEKKDHDAASAVLDKAKIDLSKAIETAQAKVPKGKPIYASTEKEDNEFLFEVYLLVGDTVTEVEVDAVTGNVAKVEENEDDDIDDLPEAKKVVAASTITFAQAITAAKEKVPGGKPFEVETEMEQGKSIIEVELLLDKKIMKVEIDAVSGKVLEVE